MKIERMRVGVTLKDDLKQKADYANTATQVTNCIVKECKELAELGFYENSTEINPEVRDEVLANLQNEFTGLKVTQDTEEMKSYEYHLISWED